MDENISLYLHNIDTTLKSVKTILCSVRNLQKGGGSMIKIPEDLEQLQKQIDRAIDLNKTFIDAPSLNMRGEFIEVRKAKLLIADKLKLIGE